MVDLVRLAVRHGGRSPVTLVAGFQRRRSSMLTRLLFAATLAGVFALPAVTGAAQHGGSGIIGATRVGDLEMDVSTEADVRAFAGNPDIVDDHSPYRWIKRLGYNCRERYCRTTYEINRGTDRLIGFATYSKQFRTRRGTRVGDTRKRAERNERRKANRKLCDEGTRAIVYSDLLWIFIYQRRVWSLVVAGSYLDC
jgi:hypothetical protein